ncbi:hypothetical protein NQ317_006234 [Molorchus minor]|uniref:Uncharacterized protein n=1 Tax=Molorchus minor TaxID=1323400 RepID=A0ABQ9K630_9CUCU|nr:hypothetical protein NQ317_006234 [Molorchus minor]
MPLGYPQLPYAQSYGPGLHVPSPNYPYYSYPQPTPTHPPGYPPLQVVFFLIPCPYSPHITASQMGLPQNNVRQTIMPHLHEANCEDSPNKPIQHWHRYYINITLERGLKTRSKS